MDSKAKIAITMALSPAAHAEFSARAVASGLTRTKLLERWLLSGDPHPAPDPYVHTIASGPEEAVQKPSNTHVRTEAEKPQKTAEPEIVKAQKLDASPEPLKVPLPRATHGEQEKFPVRDAYKNLQDAMASKVKERPDRRGRKKGGGS